MEPLITALELEACTTANTLPLSSDGETLDTARITIALQQATGIIVAQLPWLLGNDGEISRPVPAQFQAALESVCADIALLRLVGKVGSSEDDQAKYDASVKLLSKIDKEYKGGLSGPGIQESSIVYPDDEEGIDDSRFFKKGRLQ